MTKKFGPSWNCAVGSSFASEMVFQKHTSLLLYYGGQFAIVLGKNPWNQSWWHLKLGTPMCFQLFLPQCKKKLRIANLALFLPKALLHETAWSETCKLWWQHLKDAFNKLI
jgi:hypothetical protein